MSMVLWWYSSPRTNEKLNVNRLDVQSVTGIKPSQWRGILWALRRIGLVLTNGDVLIIKEFIQIGRYPN